MSQYHIYIAGETDPVYLIDTPYSEGYVLGRADEGSQFMPDLDFAPYAARERGVSRRHAALVVYLGEPHILDLNSVNGTYVDGKRLQPDQPHPLARDQGVRLGTLDIRITKE